MEIRSSLVSPCFLVMPAAKPQMDHYVSAEWEVKRPPLEIGMGVGMHSFNLGLVIHTQKGYVHLCEAHANTHTHTHRRNAYTNIKRIIMHTYR